MTLPLSLHHVQWILCYRIKNISFMVFIKQLKPRICVQCKCCYTDWSLAFEGEGCGFESPPWDCNFFSSFLFLHFFPSLLTLRVYPGVCVSVGRVLHVYLAGFLTIDFDHKHDCSGPRILEIDLVILKLSRFSQVQSERERTFLIVCLLSVHTQLFYTK